MLVLHHVTYSINSLCHFFGRRNFATPDESRNLMWLALPTFGESWHNNHHAFPTSAAHGLRKHEIDFSAMVIRALESVGLAWDVVRDRSRAPARQGARRNRLGRHLAVPFRACRSRVQLRCSASSSGRSRSARSRSRCGTARGLASTNGRRPHLLRPLPGGRRARAAGPGAARGGPRLRVSGELEVDDLDAALEMLDRWQPPPLDRGAGRDCCSPPRGPAACACRRGRRRRSCVPAGRRHSRARDARAVRHHYDLPAEFFELFLGPSMTYSCALFSRGATTLEEAQEQKLELVCTQARA